MEFYEVLGRENMAVCFAAFVIIRAVVFLGATKANNSSNTKSHFQHTHAYTSSGHMTTLSRATGVPDVYRTLH